MRSKISALLSLTSFVIILLNVSSCSDNSSAPLQNRAEGHGLMFTELPKVWDEGIPLGNGELGALIWEKEGKLRFSLDRSDLWDLRPMGNLDIPEFSFSWIKKQVDKGDYKPVQELFDIPYNRLPAPSKIPGAALEFNCDAYGKPSSVSLDIHRASCTIEWESGVILETFVTGDMPVGWFRFTGVEGEVLPELVAPEYGSLDDDEVENALTGQDLRRLGYSQGKIEGSEGKWIYRQPGWNGFEYEVAVKWMEIEPNEYIGCWTISSSFSESDTKLTAGELADNFLNKGWEESRQAHLEWWNTFWGKSMIQLPDSILENQWYMEMYKFGSAARSNTPPISLQAVWTADHGKLPPWKGDFHHDLNTQLSYWPAYSGNHLDLEEGFLNWLWKYRDTFKKYTKDFYGTNGINVPGVTTLTGEPMGGWVQYSFGPTVSAWLGQHFYLHWQYSGDEEFLRTRAYPWIKDVAVFFDEISERDENGWRKLPLSSSPEINDNRIDAWFKNTTNFDLSLIRFTFEKAAELARILGKLEEADKWNSILNEWPGLVTAGANGGLAFAPDYPYTESHRHFSHLVGWHPLGIMDWSNGSQEQQIIEGTLKDLEKYGSDWYVGYSFSWLGNLYARAFKGNKAAETLRIFAENFCLPNSFHVNGEQHDRGYSKFKYRPFTLEGNFAFASGIQEMLIQSHTGIVHLIPAIPDDWDDLEFEGLRTVGAFLFDLKLENGNLTAIRIYSEKGNKLKLKNPFAGLAFKIEGAEPSEMGEIIVFETEPGQTTEIKTR